MSLHTFKSSTDFFASAESKPDSSKRALHLKRTKQASAAEASTPHEEKPTAVVISADSPESARRHCGTAADGDRFVDNATHQRGNGKRDNEDDWGEKKKNRDNGPVVKRPSLHLVPAVLVVHSSGLPPRRHDAGTKRTTQKKKRREETAARISVKVRIVPPKLPSRPATYLPPWTRCASANFPVDCRLAIRLHHVFI